MNLFIFRFLVFSFSDLDLDINFSFYFFIKKMEAVFRFKYKNIYGVTQNMLDNSVTHFMGVHSNLIMILDIIVSLIVFVLLSVYYFHKACIWANILCSHGNDVVLEYHWEFLIEFCVRFWVL